MSIFFGSCRNGSPLSPKPHRQKALDFFSQASNFPPDSILPATKYMLSSLSEMNFYLKNHKNPSINDYEFLGLVNESIADLYNNINALKPANYFYDRAIIFYEKADYNNAILSTHLKIGKLYHYNRMYDIAILYYELAEEKDSISPQYHWKILENKALALYESGDYMTADSIMRLIGDTDKKNIAYNLAHAEMFYSRRDYKQALPYLIYSFNNGDNHDKLSAAEKLADIYFNLKDADNELVYTQYQAKITSAEIRRTPTKLAMEKIFDEHRDLETIYNREKSSRINKYQKVALSIAALLIIIVSSYFLLFRKKYREKIKAAERTINDTHETINTKDKIISDISKKLESFESKPSIATFDECYKKFTESDIFKSIKTSIDGISIFIKTIPDYSNLGLNNKQLIQLTQTVQNCFPNLTSRLKKDFPALTLTDMRFIYLILMNFSDIEIAVLLGLTYSATNKRSNKIKNIVNTEGELSHFLIEYLRENL